MFTQTPTSKVEQQREIKEYHQRLRDERSITIKDQADTPLYKIVIEGVPEA